MKLTKQEKVDNKKDVKPTRTKKYLNHTAQKLQIDPCLIIKELKEAFSMLLRFSSRRN